MRTLIDIPDRQIDELAAICMARKLPRTEVIRQAITAYIASQRPAAAEAFGLWGKQAGDGVTYQEKARAEW
jgi:predicted transcriptional regulator